MALPESSGQPAVLNQPVVNPAAWTHSYLVNLYTYDWVQTKSPAGATQWIPDNGAASTLVPDAHDPSKRHAPIMFTTDLSLKFDKNELANVLFVVGSHRHMTSEGVDGRLAEAADGHSLRLLELPQ